MPRALTVTKRRNWKPGTWAMAIKVITPEGNVLELARSKVPRPNGDHSMEEVMRALGLKRWP